MLRRCCISYVSCTLSTAFGPFELNCCRETGVCEVMVASKKNTLNLLDDEYFSSLMRVTHHLSSELNGVARVAILSSKEGTPFSGGLDLKWFQQRQHEPLDMEVGEEKTSKAREMPAMRVQQQHAEIRRFQMSVSSLANCRIPVLCAVDGCCIGGATSIITACDLRYATETASFSVREARVGLAADLGVLQRLPSIVGEGRARELVYTARSFDGKEAKQMGLLEEVFRTREDMMESVRGVATVIASNSPLAVQGSKMLMNYQTRSYVERSLEYTASWSAANISCDDVVESAAAFAKKKTPRFRNYMMDISSPMP